MSTIIGSVQKRRFRPMSVSGTIRGLAGHFFSRDVQFSTTVNGAAALAATGMGSRNFFPSELTSQAAPSGDLDRPLGLKRRVSGYIHSHHGCSVRREIKQLLAVGAPARGAAARR